MSARELAGWIEFYQIEPFGAEAAFWRAGVVASVIANAHRDRTRKTTPFTPRDFMPAEKDTPPDTIPLTDGPALHDAFRNVFGDRIVTDVGNQGREGNGSQASGYGPEDSFAPGGQGLASPGETDCEGREGTGAESERGPSQVDNGCVGE